MYICIVCGKTLEDALGDHENLTPSEGLLFTTTGNYGSTIFDPMPEEQETVYTVICDTCFVTAAESGKLFHMPDGHWLPFSLSSLN